MSDIEKASILLVDDDVNILDSARDILEDAGYAVTTAKNGKVAVAALEEGEFNLVLVDFQLPDSTGLELARKVRERNDSTLVILMTGHASLDMAVKAIQEAVYDYLIKPVDPTQLQRTIEKALSQQKLQLENRQLLQDLKQMNEKMARLDVLKSRMLKILSHDLRTPLSSVRGYSELLKSGIKGKLTEPQKKMLDITIQEADHLNGLINDLLDLAALEAGSLNLDVRPVPCEQMIDKAMQRIKLLSEMKEIPVEVIIASELPNVSMDMPRMVQVLSNIIRSALKHSARNSHIFINAGVKDMTVDIRVTYTGMGFTAAQLESLFGPVSAGAEPSGSIDGLKIALALAREILYAHQGDLGVESRGVEHGATFWMKIPATADLA